MLDAYLQEAYVLHDGPPYANGELHIGELSYTLEDWAVWNAMHDCMPTFCQHPYSLMHCWHSFPITVIDALPACCLLHVHPGMRTIIALPSASKGYLHVIRPLMHMQCRACAKQDPERLHLEVPAAARQACTVRTWLGLPWLAH